MVVGVGTKRACGNGVVDTQRGTDVEESSHLWLLPK
jgi:hypothetical protein